MPSRWDTANRGWRRRVFHYPPPTLLSGNFRLPCAIELQPFSLTPLKMRKVQARALTTKAATSGRRDESTGHTGSTRSDYQVDNTQRWRENIRRLHNGIVAE